MAELKISDQRCKGCGLCVVYCPKESLRMSEAINSRGYHFPECFDPESCTGCILCAIICPEIAIEVYK